MFRNSVPLTSGYTGLLSLLNLDTSAPITLGLSKEQTRGDSFDVFATLDAATLDATNAQQIGVIDGTSSQNLLADISNQARGWPYVFLRRTAGSTAGTFYATGDETVTANVLSTAAPVIGGFSTVFDLSAFSSSGVRVGGSAEMTGDDQFDVFFSQDGTVSSSSGCVYAGRITGGGGTGLISLVNKGWPYATISRVSGSTAGNILAAGTIAQLNTLGIPSPLTFTLVTVNNTPVNALSIPLSPDSTVLLRAEVTVRETGTVNRAEFWARNTFSRTAAGASSRGGNANGIQDSVMNTFGGPKPTVTFGDPVATNVGTLIFRGRPAPAQLTWKTTYMIQVNNE